MARILHYRAGAGARRLLREGSLGAAGLAGLVGPASGPKWLVLAGLDRALLASALLPRHGAPCGRTLLVGASAGAWRMIALASANPEATHRRLLEGYINQLFPPGFTPGFVSGAYRRLLAELLSDGAVGHLLDHPRFDVAVHAVRVRRPLGWGGRFTKQAQLCSLGLTALLQALSPSGTERVLERVLFHTAPSRLDAARFDGPVVPLTVENLLDATLASGTVPLYMTPVRDPHGAPTGLYLDGGLSDYHLRENYAAAGITLFPHFQRRIVPAWFDRYWPRRAPSMAALDHVLQLYPSTEFVSRLPDGRLPDRQDFFTFHDRPQERIRRWNEAAALGDELGQALIDDLAAGRIPDLVEPF